MSTATKELDRVRAIVGDVRFPGYRFEVGVYTSDIFFIQVTYEESDVMTGVTETQSGRQWAFRSGQTASQLVQTCLKALLTSLEHRAREHFLWRGKPVLQPHLDVEQLWSMLPDAERHAEEIPFGGQHG